MKTTYSAQAFSFKTGNCLVFAVLLLCMSLALHAETVRVVFSKTTTPVPSTPEGYVILRLHYKIDGTPTDTQKKAVKEYLENANNYLFTNDWPDTTEAVTPSSAVLPFAITGTIQADQPDTLGNRALNIPGRLAFRASGSVHIAQTPAGSDFVLSMEDPTASTIALGYSFQRDIGLSGFGAKANIGIGKGGLSIDFSGSGVLGSRLARFRKRLTTLSIEGKLPLYTPDDVRKTSGASRDASRQVADLLGLSLNSVGYRRGGNLDRYGLKLRATGSLRGLEAVGYYSPLSTPLPNAIGYAAAELEVGYRNGDAEFTNLVTRAPNPGNYVARLGGLLELTPRIEPLGINRNLSKGLRFFIRVRGWLDTFQGVSNDTGVRLRVFADSELFYNFTANSRIFLRGETGYLPPDLAKPSERVYIGVGAAF